MRPQLGTAMRLPAEISTVSDNYTNRPQSQKLGDKSFGSIVSSGVGLLNKQKVRR